MSDIQDEAYSEAMEEISKLGDKIEYLEGQIAENKVLMKRASDALEEYSGKWVPCFNDEQLVADLRKAAE